MAVKMAGATTATTTTAAAAAGATGLLCEAESADKCASTNCKGTKSPSTPCTDQMRTLLAALAVTFLMQLMLFSKISMDHSQRFGIGRVRYSNKIRHKYLSTLYQKQHVNLSESIPAILLVKEENKEKNKEKNGNSERSVLKDSSTLLRPQEQIETSAPSIVNVSDCTLVISAAKSERLVLLKHILASMCKAHPISRILIRWFGDGSESGKVPMSTAELDSICPDEKRIILEPMKEKNLTSRFLPSDKIVGACTIIADDDIWVPTEDIEFAYKVWLQNRERLVGFFARSHYGDKTKGLSYSNSINDYSMILTKFMFLDSKYLHSFFDDKLVPSTVRAYIDQRRNCEDIAMNFLVAEMSQLPPIKVPGHPVDFGDQRNYRKNGLDSAIYTSSLSNQKLWFRQRSICLKYFAKNFDSGKEILPKSTSFIVPEDGQEHTRCILGSQVEECPPVLVGDSMIRRVTAMEFDKSRKQQKDHPPFAFAIAVENRECAQHAQLLVHSLRKAETKADIVVLVPRDKVASADGDFDSVDALFPNAKVIRIDVNTSRLSTRSSEDYSCCLSDVINNYFWTLDDYEKVGVLSPNMLVMRNIDNAFLRKVTSSITTSSRDVRGCVSSDIPVIKPRQEVFNLLDSAIDVDDDNFQGPQSTTKNHTATRSSSSSTITAVKQRWDSVLIYSSCDRARSIGDSDENNDRDLMSRFDVVHFNSHSFTPWNWFKSKSQHQQQYDHLDFAAIFEFAKLADSHQDSNGGFLKQQQQKKHQQSPLKKWRPTTLCQDVAEELGSPEKKASDGLSLVIFSTSTRATVDCVKHYTDTLGGALIKKIIVQQMQGRGIPKHILSTGVPLDLLSKQFFTSGFWTSPFRGIETDAVLLLSDQVLFHPEDIECAFRLWRLNHLVPVIGSEEAGGSMGRDEDSAGLNENSLASVPKFVLASNRLLFYQSCLLPQELMPSLQACGHLSLSMLAYGMLGLQSSWIRLNSFHQNKGGSSRPETQLNANRYAQCWESLASFFELSRSTSSFTSDSNDDAVAEFMGSQVAFSCPSPRGQSR